MDPKNLSKLWSAPDNTRLTSKQMSIRLPVHVAAKIAAICEMYPRRNKTEVIGDLLAAALTQFADGLSSEPDEGDEMRGIDPRVEWCGERGEYERLVKKKLEEYEKEEMGLVEK